MKSTELRENKAQRTNPPCRPYTHRNPPQVIFGTYRFSCVILYFLARFVEVSRRGESANHVRNAGVAIDAKQERIKRVFPPLM